MRKNKWFWIILVFFSPLFSFVGISLKEMPNNSFLIIILVISTYLFICIKKIFLINKEIKKKSQKKYKLKRKIRDLNDIQGGEILLVEHQEKLKNIQKRTEKLSKKREKTIQRIKTTVIILMLFSVIGYKPLNTLAKEIIKEIAEALLEPFDEQEEQPVPVEPIKQDEQEEQPVPVEPIKQEKSWIKFSLEYPDGYPFINDEELETLYNSLFYNNKDILDEAIKSDINTWLNSCKDNNSLNTVVTSSNKNTEDLSDIESNFTNEDGVLLSSNVLDDVIDGRKELYALCPNRTLAWLLANHMQTYALNYLYQTKNEKSVLYFYLKSIEYVQESLEFNMSPEIKHKQIQYLQARYKDIGDCVYIEEDIRLKAYEIYNIIDKTLKNL